MYTHTKHQIDMNSDFRYTQRLIYVGKSLFFLLGDEMHFQIHAAT